MHEFLPRKNSKLKNGRDAVFQHNPLRKPTSVQPSQQAAAAPLREIHRKARTPPNPRYIKFFRFFKKFSCINLPNVVYSYRPYK
jgi:hypothetical protein